MTFSEGTRTTNTPRGAFSTHPSPYLGGPSNGGLQQQPPRQEDFDLGPPATRTSMPSDDQTLEAFLSAVAKGDFFSGQTAGLAFNSSFDTVMNHNGSVLPTVAPNPHVCHWQNCHADFATVQELLSHVSSEHLKIKSGKTQQEATPVYQFGTATSTSNEQAVRRSTLSPNDVTSSQSNPKSQNGIPAFSALAERFGASSFGGSSGMQRGFVDMTGPSATKNDGLMACLWDDCIPGPEVGVVSQPFTGAFAQNASSSDQTLERNDSNDWAQDLESFRLLSQKMNANKTSETTSLQHSATTQHVHRVCQAPVPVHNDNPLDSASAVLKHLLEQHLGTDATNSLLNIAQNHYTSISANQQNTKRGSVDSVSSAFASPSLVPPPRKLNQTESRLDSARETPQSRSSETTEAPVNFRCLWHGCDKVFDTCTSLTDHISHVHVGRGKSKYECLWEGCVRCDNECDSCDEGDRMDTDTGEKRGRKFGTRQKVLRHIQSHTGESW
jgi:hypothetical protein